MSGWKFIKMAIASVMLMTFLAVPIFLKQERDKGNAPNVLFIVADDLNDWVGCLGGHPDTYTPNIDRLAERGLLFTNAHTPAPLCNPSRVGVLTGIRPSTSGVYSNLTPFRRALPKAVTLPQHFMAHGYKVLGTGKVFHDRFPDPESWHTYFPSREKRLLDPKPKGRPLSGISNADWIDWGPLDVKDDEMADFQRAEWVAEQLRKKHDRPFFLAVGITRPHLPWYAPKKYFERFPPDKITLPDVNQDDLRDIPPIGQGMVNPTKYKRPISHSMIIEHHQWRKAVSAYLASIHFADAIVGKILDALDSSPYAENTMIVLWSDNGMHLGEKLHWRKFSLWEESTHVPLVFVVPGVTEPGGRSSRPVSLIDIYPTLIDLCGLSPKTELEGKSLLPLLEDPSAAWVRPALTGYRRNKYAVRSERWRYIRYHDGTEELYDHQTDEFEWTNLADREEYAGIKESLAQWIPLKNAPEATEY